MKHRNYCLIFPLLCLVATIYTPCASSKLINTDTITTLQRCKLHPEYCRHHHHHHRHHHIRYHWEKSHRGNIPFDAITGGHESRRTFYICHAHFRGDIHPGKTVDGNCNITYGGKEIKMNHFRVLVGHGLRWQRAVFGDVPDNAVEGGYEGGQTLYICQARYMGGDHPGKVVGRYCNIGYGGREIKRPVYNVLVH